MCWPPTPTCAPVCPTATTTPSSPTCWSRPSWRAISAPRPSGFSPARARRRPIRRLTAAAPHLPDGIELWLETHDSHRTGAAIAAVLDAVGHPRVRAIWDIAHPPKAGEAWPDTLTAIWPHLAHVQIKDELPGQVPLFLGDGDVPILPIVAALLDRGYPGWFSLEYELKWHPTAPPLAEALHRGTAWLQSSPMN